MFQTDDEPEKDGCQSPDPQDVIEKSNQVSTVDKTTDVNSQPSKTTESSDCNGESSVKDQDLQLGKVGLSQNGDW